MTNLDFSYIKEVIFSRYEPKLNFLYNFTADKNTKFSRKLCSGFKDSICKRV
jgi:hypothetical protein